MPAILSDAVSDVVTAVAKLCADDQLVTDPEMMLGDTEALLDAKAQLDSVITKRLRSAEAVDATTEEYGRGTKRWLIEEVLLPGGEAARLMRLTRRGIEHPQTMALLESGRINSAHADAIMTALHALPIDLRDTVEPHLLDRAREFPPEEIAGFVDELLQGLGIDKHGDIAREKRYADRGVDIATTMHGTRSLSGHLTPDVGDRFQAALDVAAQKTGADDDRTGRQRRHDALGILADAFLAQSEPSFTGAPRTVIVTIDLALLEDRLRDACITLPGGPNPSNTVSADTARRLACDAELIPVVLGGRSEILDIGHAGHEFTAAQRRAAWLRDGGCVFPGCRNTPAELHHLVFRRHGGPNTLHNAAWLCNYHHWLVHEGRWTLQRQPDRNYLWTSPHGKQLVRVLARGSIGMRQ